MGMREEFEARFPVPSGVAWSQEHQNYGWVKKSAFQKTITYRALFTGWKTCCESLVIELPPGGYFAGYDNEHMMESRDVREAIEAAGLKVKP